ncbi:hypothetical protein FOA52_009939 [Chlamydomonas sp. UWO 241]|nr:hypothetical protein FOA52_009939 [Chlamydomonas sp. UWO 241]
MSFNVYYAALGGTTRLDGIAQAIANYRPDIASLQEMWGERDQILSRVRSKTGLDYALSSGAQLWDGDILYRADCWKVVEDGVIAYDGNRGMTWASMAHVQTVRNLLVYGMHLLCRLGTDVQPHLRNVEMLTAHAAARRERPDAPVLALGDFNAHEQEASMALMRQGSLGAYGRGHTCSWSTTGITFIDTLRSAPNAGPGADGNTGFGPKIAYIYTEAGRFVTTSAAIVRNAPGGSVHFPVTAEVVLV